MKKNDSKPSHPLRFRALILSSGKTAAGIQIAPEVVEALGGGKRPPVRVTINGYTYRSSIAVLNGVFMLGVSAQVREQAGVNAGEQVDVELELDTQPREISLPPDFSAALRKEPQAAQFFETLSYSNKRRIVEPIGQAKTAETRQRRIEKAVASLREGRV